MTQERSSAPPADFSPMAIEGYVEKAPVVTTNDIYESKRRAKLSEEERREEDKWADFQVMLLPSMRAEDFYKHYIVGVDWATAEGGETFVVSWKDRVVDYIMIDSFTEMSKKMLQRRMQKEPKAIPKGNERFHVQMNQHSRSHKR